MENKMRNIFEEETEYYYSYAEVDLARIRQNFFNLQAACDKKIIPVVKGDAWGQGIVPVTAMLFEKAGCDIAAVAQVIEGIKLREAGCHFSASRTRGGDDYQRSAGFDIIVLSVALVADDPGDIGRIAFNYVMAVGLDAHML